MIGRTLGHYKILDRLGTGGMGVVWLAEDLELGRRVAIKMLREDVAASPEKRARFEREARSVAALNHPNIVTLFAVEEFDGQRFLAMEYVEGRTLDDLLDNGPLPSSEVLRIGIGVSAALEAAHRSGIVHRDLKPSNVLLGPDGRIKVVDFGLARSFDTESFPAAARPRETSLTQEGLAVGTLHYMSPEQLQNRKVDHRTDLFALGILLYEAATGKMPFPGESAAQVITAVLRDPPRRIEGEGVKLPPQIFDLLQALLAKEPDDRPSTAGEVRAALEAAQLLFQSETAALPTSRSSRNLVRPPGRAAGRRRAMWLGAAAAAPVLVLAALAVRGRLRSTAEPPPSPTASPAPTVAVLPLQSFSGGPDYFVDGMTDELIGALARLGGLRVVSRQSSMRYKGSDELLPAIARELGADYLVEGSVSRSDQTVRLQLSLRRPDPEESIWASAVERPVSDVLDLHQETARAIARALNARISAAPSGAAGEVDPVLYDQLLRAQYHANLLTRADLERSNELYRKALAQDPSLASAWAGTALNWALLGYFGVPAEEAAREAGDAVARALALDTGLAEAHATLGLVEHLYRWNWSAAEREYRRAIELNANDASSRHRLWALLMPQGRREEAERELQAARRLDPLSMSIAVNLGQHLALVGDVESGLVELQRAADLEPGSGLPQFHLWWIHHRLGHDEEAAAALVAGLRGFGLTAAADAASATLATGDYRAALERAAEKAAEQAAATGTMAYNVAELYAAAGRQDQALTWLRRGFLARAPEMPWITVSPLFEPLRERAEFRELVSALGLDRRGAAGPSG